MKQADLDAVREASRGERAHAGHVAGDDDSPCMCPKCRERRRIIARHTPALLRFIDDALAQPRREHIDLGDLD